ncbi:hypothetical protein Taro_015395 [Colocasia esculenta]|uniref:Uncharacterized protein n=1 Tax=Colocasia esculenta TaxID=4460 RepID=A0A843UHA6_COLES|nr:hypothetical protein [Colocasia esculenta]
MGPSLARACKLVRPGQGLLCLVRWSDTDHWLSTYGTNWLLSSLGFAAMVELGPFRIERDGKSLRRNSYSWNSAPINAFPFDVASSYGSTPPQGSFKRAPQGNHPERSIAELLSGMLPDRGINSAVLDNYGHYRTASSTPSMGHLLGDLLQRLPSSSSRPHGGSQTVADHTRPTIKRRVNCLTAQRASQRVTPPVMHAFQGAIPGTIW